jgi:hypothetical protein
MPRLVRMLLAVLLVLAVPLQGLAGVTMAACAEGHGHSGVEAHDHAAMAHGHDAAGHDHAAMGHGADPGPVHDGHDCAACAACCSLSAVVMAVLVASAGDPPSSAVIPFFGAAHASVPARGLERPPSASFPG